MTTKVLKPKISLNKAFLKVKPNRTAIEGFKNNLIQLLDRINDYESEEFHKNLVIDFLKKTYYEPEHFINTKGRNDLVIHNGKDAQSPVGVILEAKKTTNKAEMVSEYRINTKSFHELVLYYLRERITHENLEIKHLIITNINEWFIFDAVIFERYFAQNKAFVKQFEDFENGRLPDNRTEFFYKSIAEPFIDRIEHEVAFTYFNIQDYARPLRNADKKDDNKLIALYKLLSPEHLLKLPFANDSNSLDKRFYGELLHIIGLTETKDGGKKLIDRNKEGERHSGTFIEDAIIQLDSRDKIGNLDKPSIFGNSTQERLFNVALTLSITWINRILFLKLLEAQLISYHKGDKNYAFLNSEKIKNYDDLDSLFFDVLAKNYAERNADVKAEFANVPYLNSSLFEPTDIEQQTVFIGNLKNDKSIPVYSQTVLKDASGKKRTGSLPTLQYLFQFLDAYDFSSEGSEEIQEDNKTLINASVLGLIFEKINGYKDGSFFTPGFITMFMCRETIRRAVIQKFNETKGWNCETIAELYNKIEDRKEANQIVNSIKICDPAVGSGHFLVSALNEMIAVKNDLKILEDRSGKRLKEYNVEVVNDELVVTDDDGELFEYNPKAKESQRIQETLFHEKQTIIEHCLFGVDLNQNSVKICRLRLWIELLKNAYYKSETELETLPNIDINIKSGNSLVSRFEIDADLSQALKKSKWTIDSYRVAVDTYRKAKSKEEKRAMKKLIADIKSDFRSEITKNDPKIKRLQKLNGDLYNMTHQQQLFEMSKKEKTEWNKKLKKLSDDTQKLETEIEAIKANKIYENAFEWRFEFPEVLNDEGDFVGFDVLIGNPPYVQLQKMGKESDDLGKMGFETFIKTGDIYSLFYELGYRILKPLGVLTYITSNKWMRAGYGASTRKFFVEQTNPLILIDFAGVQIFDSATVDTNILMFTKDKNRQQTQACIVKDKALKNLSDYFRQYASDSNFGTSDSWVVLSEIEQRIKKKIETVGTPLKDWNINIYRGILTGYNEAFIIDGEKRKQLIEEDAKSAEIIRPLLRGRDIKRYAYEFADLYLITTFPSLKIDIEEYPSIKSHLLSFGYDRLKQTGDKGARKQTNNKWFETQDSIAYWEDFFRPKIIWGEISDKTKFTIELDGKYINEATTFLMSGESLLYLVGYLNSKLSEYLFSKIGTTTGVGTIRWKKFTIEQLLVPKINSERQQVYEKLVLEIVNCTNSSGIIPDLAKKLDYLIYQDFHFNQEEIQFIESQ